VQVFLETERLVLRRFTTGDVDNLAGLDACINIRAWPLHARP